MDKPIGKVAHYYDKIGVAVIDVEDGSLKVGDTVKFSGHENEFTQKIESMQLEHEQVQEAKKGMSVGVKVDQKVKENDLVYNVS